GAVKSLMGKIKNLSLCCTLAIIYFLSAKLGLTFAFEQANVSPVWPPTGLAIAALLYFGYQLWPGVFFGALLLGISIDTPIIPAILISIGNTLEALAASFLILKLIHKYPFYSIKSIFTFSALILLTTVISATIGVGSLYFSTLITEQQVILLWTTWWLGDAVGGLLFTPLLLTLVRKPAFAIDKSRFYELTALVACSIISTFVVFSTAMTLNQIHYAFAFFLIPTIVWSALRFYQHGASCIIMFYALVAIYSTLQDNGPFTVSTANESLLLLQSFIAIIMVTALALAASASETKRIENQLLDTQGNLRQLLEERTEALDDSRSELNAAVGRSEACAVSMRKLLQASMLSSGEPCFNGITKELAQIYNTDYAFIGVFADNSQLTIRTLSLWCKNKHIDNFSYPLKDTPCQDVLDFKMELIERDVATQYPNDPLLIEMNIESYFGAPIISSTGTNLGIVVVMDSQSMEVSDWVKPTLNIIATRVSFELERNQAKQELQLAASVFKETAEAIIICDKQQRMLRVNPAFTRITGYSAKEAIGQTPKLFTSDRHSRGFYQSFWQIVDATGSWQGEVWDKRKDGKVFPCWQTITAVRDKQGQVKQYIGVFSDISSKKQAEEQIYHLAHFDILTGLPNRGLFIEQLGQAMKKAAVEQHSLALLFMDLDHFKLVNNAADHSTGDILLMHVADRLRKFANNNVVVSRLGGDEFTILLKNMTTEQEVSKLAQDILKELSTPFKLAPNEVIVSASIGICTYPNDADSAHELLRNADTAMYKAKESGRKKVKFYTPDMNRKAKQRVEIEQSLRLAIKEQQFVLHYQPQVQLSTGRVIGVEALVRWQHPQQGLLSPYYFIPIAEESGLIVPLGEWILEEACHQFVRWQKQGIELNHMAVNLSARQFVNNDIEATVKKVLTKTGIRPEHLELELTESMLMKNVEQTIATMNRLRQMGIALSIDDFGTGYSSMAYLKHFPIDKLKIDKSFIDDLLNASADAAIVNSTISLAHGLGLLVIAEGVETAEQAAYLKAHNCEEIQGYYFSVPYPGDSPGLLALFNGETPKISAMAKPEC
ncbi:MAG: diguanylate cyclase (GGDEF)-like protein/PAS domain S-box-containing protein, partial [Phenylobacterium sp.]